ADVESLAKERPRVLLVVGYAERDEAVVRRLISPLEQRWRVFRVGPDAPGAGAIRAPAIDCLTAIADALCPPPEAPDWAFVSFDNQRGLEAAISGERLGPRDVDACPQLPHADSARTALELMNNVDIAG